MSSLLAPHLFLLQPPAPALTLGLSDPPSPPPPPLPPAAPPSSSSPSPCTGLRLLSPSDDAVSPLADPGLVEAYPPGAALRNDLGSNISVLKTLNLRFRCFLAKVHGLERRNRALEAELQRERARHRPGEGERPLPVATWDRAVQAGPGGLARPQASGLGWNPGLGGMARPQASGLGWNVGLGGLARPQASGLAWNASLGGVARRQASGLGWGSGQGTDGVGVQTDTVTPELRALHNVLATIKRERDELRVRWEQEYNLRVQLEQRVAVLEEELEKSVAAQEDLLLKVQRLKSDLVLFKGLMSNDLTDLDTKIQEKAMRVDMDICRRIDITAKLCDVAQQRNCQDMIEMLQVPVPASLRKVLPGHGDAPQPDPEVPSDRAERCELTNSVSINEEIQRMLNQLREYDFEDECDSLAWEETDETLLLWDDLSNCAAVPGDAVTEQEESLEKVIKDTECLFKTREREYQRTIDQIELELATAKNDMNRHLHEYMEMCSMKRGLDVQMETCRQLMTQSERRNTATPVPGANPTEALCKAADDASTS